MNDVLWFGGVFGLLAACSWSVVLWARRSSAVARARVIESALGRGERVVISSGNRWGYPYRVALGGRVLGFREWHEVVEAVTLYEEGRERELGRGVVISHPSLG